MVDEKGSFQIHCAIEVLKKKTLPPPFSPRSYVLRIDSRPMARLSIHGQLVHGRLRGAGNVGMHCKCVPGSFMKAIIWPVWDSRLLHNTPTLNDYTLLLPRRGPTCS